MEKQFLKINLEVNGFLDQFLWKFLFPLRSYPPLLQQKYAVTHNSSHLSPVKIQLWKTKIERKKYKTYDFLIWIWTSLHVKMSKKRKILLGYYKIWFNSFFINQTNLLQQHKKLAILWTFHQINKKIFFDVFVIRRIIKMVINNNNFLISVLFSWF